MADFPNVASDLLFNLALQRCLRILVSVDRSRDHFDDPTAIRRVRGITKLLNENNKFPGIAEIA